MGYVRTKTVKKFSHRVIEKYYSRMTLDFHTNNKILEVAIFPSKHLRNEIASFSTHIMKHMDFVPEESTIKTDGIEVDKDVIYMLADLGMADLPGVVKIDNVAQDGGLVVVMLVMELVDLVVLQGDTRELGLIVNKLPYPGFCLYIFIKFCHKMLITVLFLKLMN
ncbi:hypothetical protein MKX03_014678 [Papaver bracteatum]|nr:hypothetical protein MKX03_014678 [Papaver bracteatum]